MAVVTSASPGTDGPAALQLAAAGYPVSGASRTAPARGRAVEHVVIDVRRRTAEHHVEHILAKLDVTSRTAVAYALTHELLSRTEPGATLS